MSILTLYKVSKSYGAMAPALYEITFTIEEGEFAALAGPSGSGKTTILNLASGLDRPTTGTVKLLGKQTGQLTEAALANMRRGSIGYVFQAYNLFPVLTAIENVEYPLALRHIPPKDRHYMAKSALEEVGLGDLGNRFPSQLSGGQQQRVTIARAIVCKPSIIFADEPTANLDSKTAIRLIALFQELNEKKNITFLFSSHDPMVLKSAHRILEVFDGKIKSDTPNEFITKKVLLSQVFGPLLPGLDPDVRGSSVS